MWLYFYKDKKNLRFTGKDLTVCSRIRVCLAGQHDRPIKLLAGQDTLMAGRCLLSGPYIDTWKCTILHANVWVCRRNTKALLKEQTYRYYFHPVPFVRQIVCSFAFSFWINFWHLPVLKVSLNRPSPFHDFALHLPGPITFLLKNLGEGPSLVVFEAYHTNLSRFLNKYQP